MLGFLSLFFAVSNLLIFCISNCTRNSEGNTNVLYRLYPGAYLPVGQVSSGLQIFLNLNLGKTLYSSEGYRTEKISTGFLMRDN